MSVIERAERYLAACDPAISGAGGHATTFRAACALIRGFCLSPIEGFRLLKIYNEKCRPPWSDSELRHKILSAAGAGSRKGRGYLLGDGAGILASESINALASSPPVLKWPEPDLDTIDRIVRNGPAPSMFGKIRRCDGRTTAARPKRSSISFSPAIRTYVPPGQPGISPHGDAAAGVACSRRCR
jgi:hypothetical protein